MNEEEEIKALNLKNQLMREIEEYCNDKRKNKKMSNLDNKEKTGLKTLKEKCKKELIVSQTDKSGKFSVDDRDNYIQAMKVHIEKDESITEEEHIKAQKEANAHSTFWAKILGISKDTGKGTVQKQRNHQRAKNNLMVESSELPPVYGLRKDHKHVEDNVKGPPLRPVCSASAAYNSKLAHLITTYLAKIWKNEEENCASTEELLAEFDEINKNQKGLTHNSFVGSADVIALYPSLNVERVADVVAEMIQNSEIKLEGIDYIEVGMYLAICKDSKELEELKIQELCPKRKHKQGRKPTLTGQATSNPIDRMNTWHAAEKEPENEEEKKNLLAEATKVVLKFLLQNHMYSFDGEQKKQRDGGPIGLVLTDAVAKIFMTWWDRKVKEKAEREGLEILLYKRYVDDINVIASVKKNEENTSTDRRKSDHDREKEGMELFQRIGNSIDESIKLEIDHPSKHEDMKMPLLDVKVWIERTRMSEGNNEEGNLQIMYEHYRKDIASNMTVHARSAIPMQQKRNIMTQEVIRILKNCSQDLPWEIKAAHLEQFSLRMQYSGYDVKFRRQVIKSGIKAYRKMEKNDKEGYIPLHRTREWRKNDREKSKALKKDSWFKKGGNESVIFVPATPKGELKKKMQGRINESDMKIKVIEKTGCTIKRVLQKTSIAEKKECQDKECVICKTSGKKGLCRKESITYEIVCKACKERYIGETGRCGKERCKEHAEDLKKKKESSVLWRHCKEKHGGEKQEFVYKVKQIFGNDATLRQVTEAIDIKREENAINNKTEWNHTSLPRLGVLE